METINKSPISLTPSAAKEIKRILALEPAGSTKYLRIGVKGGGCSGMTYILGFEDKDEKDSLLDIDGIPCIMNMAHAIYLKDMGNFKKIVALRKQYFTEPYPADTIIEISSLYSPDALIEIDAIGIADAAVQRK